MLIPCTSFPRCCELLCIAFTLIAVMNSICIHRIMGTNGISRDILSHKISLIKLFRPRAETQGQWCFDMHQAGLYGTSNSIIVEASSGKIRNDFVYNHGDGADVDTVHTQ